MRQITVNYNHLPRAGRFLCWSSYVATKADSKVYVKFKDRRLCSNIGAHVDDLNLTFRAELLF